MARPDYCPVGNEPCQSMCDEPCSWQGAKRRAQDVALIRLLVEAAGLGRRLALMGGAVTAEELQTLHMAEQQGRARLEKAP